MCIYEDCLNRYLKKKKEFLQIYLEDLIFNHYLFRRQIKIYYFEDSKFYMFESINFNGYLITKNKEIKYRTHFLLLYRIFLYIIM